MLILEIIAGIVVLFLLIRFGLFGLLIDILLAILGVGSSGGSDDNWGGGSSGGGGSSDSF